MAHAVRTRFVEDNVIERSKPLHALAVCVLMSCAHGTASRAVEPAPTSAKPSQPPAVHSAPALEPEPSDPDALALYMPEHFQIVTWARDSIINGELELMREPLMALATYEYKDVAPGAWIEGVGRVQQLAGGAAKVETIPQAARGIAAIANECGQCHRAMNEPSSDDELEPLPQQRPGESFRQRMRRHGWALDRMWEGLVLPSERSWLLGAAALAGGPTEAPHTDPPLAPDARNALEALRGLGARAEEAQGSAARSEVYAELLVGCSSCHRSVY